MAKRQHNGEDQMDGRIVRIKLENFLTYDRCEFVPGDKLNVILGPNGTGKSSIVCAICLGLGGHPSLLGRAKDIGDYVKHRMNEGLIEIELLKHNGPNLVVRRIIKKGKDRAKSDWYMNGKQTHVTAVAEAVGKMNVQMNNLCQFLPQDKVVEFAKMNPQQLLEATEKAVGPPGMHDDHIKIIELRSDFATIQNSKAEKEQARDRTEQRNKLLERDVQRHKERETHEEKIEFLEKKKPWVEYQTAREAFMEAKNDKADIEKKMAELKKENAPMEKKLKKCQDTLAGVDSKITQLKQEGNTVVRKHQQTMSKLEKEQEKIEEVKQELSAVKKEESNRQKKIERLEKEIQSLQKEYEAAPDPDELKPEVDEIQSSTREIAITLNKYTKECQEYASECNKSKAQIQALKSRLRELENYENQRLETLRRIDKNAYDAILWLRENKDKFRGTVYEPIMTQINMKNIKDSLYLESIVSFNDMKAFVCQNREDQHIFSNQTRDILKLNVNIVCPPGDAKDKYLPTNPLNSIKQYGFKNYVTDLYDAPLTVHQYICENYHLYNIPIGTKKIDQDSERIIEATQGISRFCSPDNIYTVRKSRYSGHSSTSINQLKQNANLLKTSVDMEQKKKLDSELEEAQQNYDMYSTKHQEAKKEYDVSVKQQETLREKRTTLLTQMKRRTVIASQIESKQKRLGEFQEEAPNIEAEEKKALKKIDNINKKRVQLTKEIKEFAKGCIDIGKARLEMTLKQTQYRLELKQMEEKHRQSTESLKTLEESHGLVTRRCVELKNRARDLVKKAQAKTGKGDDGQLIPAMLQEIFDTLPGTLEEIEALIHEEQARLNCQYETNPMVIQDYEKNKKEIISLEKEIATQTTELVEMEKEIKELLERWLVPLELLLKRINEQYCEFFRRMGCAGQVSLQRDPDDDYKKFGVEIQVKFRAEEKLKALTSYFQSGGERSVSTMLYLISLQEMTKCPFRLVDEINQGMDPVNERRVFELVVETVCRPNTSQYFLITPKLLPDLHYTDGMTILTVLNGHWMVPHEQFDMSHFIATKKKLNETNKSHEIAAR